MPERQPLGGLPPESPEDELRRLRAELDSARYENDKLRTINEVLMQRVEMGWGNDSTAYSSFQQAAQLSGSGRKKATEPRDGELQLQQVGLDLNRSRREFELSRQRLVELIESLSDAIAFFDQDRRLLLANSHFLNFWRDTGATITVGKTRLRDLLPLAVRHGIFDPRDRSGKRQVQGRTRLDGSVFRLTDGTWMQMSERLTSDGGLALVYTDVTRLKEEEQQRQEAVLEERSRMLQSIVDNMPQGVCLVNASHELECWNQRFVELTGLGPDAIRPGIDVLKLLRGTEVYAEAVTFHHSQGRPAAFALSSDKEKWLSNGLTLDIRSRPIAGGGYLHTYADITDRSRNAEALRESEKRIRLVTNAMPALISYINEDGRYEFANRAFEDWFGVPSEDIEGMFMREVLGDTEYDNISEYVTRALDGNSVDFEVEQQFPDGRRRTSFKTFIPHRGMDGEVMGFFALEQDVTEQRRTAQALKHAYRHMEQRVFERTRDLSDLNSQLQLEIEERAQIEAELLEATRTAEEASESKVKFIAAAGHDLLQPLNAARLFSASLMERDLGEDTQRLAASLGRSLDDVESIITTLVDISKLEAGVVEAVPEPFRIGELLTTLANEFSPQCQQVGLAFHHVSSRMVVNSDSQLLARILRNLLTNAIRYTDSGRILLGCRRRPGALEIQVHDTGIGIPEDKLPLIFEEFQQIHGQKRRDDKGLGLGLSIVEKLAALLNCRVDVQSVADQGSVFSVTVPYGELQEQAEDAPSIPMLADALEGRRILVIDNEAAICEGMSVMLSDWGCDVVTAQHLSELGADSDALEPPPELVIADYHLDDGDTGLDALELVAQCLGACPPVVMITANYTAELRHTVNELGYRLLNKPVKPLKLRSMITHLLS